MTKTERTILISLAFFLIVGIAVRIAQTHFSKVQLEVTDSRRLSQDQANLNAFRLGSLRVDLNSAQASDFDKLPAIGPKLSQKIVQYRNEKGKFKAPEEIVNVIGKERYEKLREYLFVDGKSGAFRSSTAKQKQFGVRSCEILINLNNATVNELASLPLVNLDLAEKIVEHRRTHGLFKEKNELLGVKGVGVPLYKRIEPYLVVK